MNEKKLWFKRKRYGWGWTPSTWQGWLIIFGYLAIIFSMIPRIENHETAFIVIFALLSVLLVFISWKKGEKVDWTKFKQD